MFLIIDALKDMETTNTPKIRRPRRSKADIEAAIQKAAITQIKKKGFARALVTDIVKRAKIEPIVFYNRFKNLDEFYDSFVKRYDYWISDLTRDLNKDLDTEEGYVGALHTVFDALLEDNLMAELLRWEIAEGTPITERTAKLREIDLSMLIEQFEQKFAARDIDGVAISALMIAGIYFMVLHKDRSAFGGIDINTDEGRKRISATFAQIGRLLYRAHGSQERRKRLETCLRKEGLSPDAIERCLAELND